MGNRTRGIYSKFKVERTDGATSEGGKHHLCAHFVLDLNCDKHAIPALKAYMESCKEEYPVLYEDLKEMLRRIGEAT